MAVSLLIDKSTNLISDAYLNISGQVEVHRPLPFTFLCPVVGNADQTISNTGFTSLMASGTPTFNIPSSYSKYDYLQVDFSLFLNNVSITNNPGPLPANVASVGLPVFFDFPEVANLNFIRFPNTVTSANAPIMSMVLNGTTYSGCLSYTDYVDISDLVYPLSTNFEILVSIAQNYQILQSNVQNITGNLMVTFTGFNSPQGSLP